MSQEITRIEGLDARQNAILAALRLGNTRTAAAEAAGVHRDTLYTWIRQNPTFAEAVRTAEAGAEVDFTGIVRNGAAGGQIKKRTLTRKASGDVIVEEEWTVPDWRAAAWWLDRRKRSWQPPKPVDLSTLTDEQLAMVLAQEAESGSDEEATAASVECTAASRSAAAD